MVTHKRGKKAAEEKPAPKCECKNVDAFEDAVEYTIGPLLVIDKTVTEYVCQDCGLEYHAEEELGDSALQAASYALRSHINHVTGRTFGFARAAMGFTQEEFEQIFGWASGDCEKIEESATCSYEMSALRFRVSGIIEGMRVGQNTREDLLEPPAKAVSDVLVIVSGIEDDEEDDIPA
jgi:hypothetical protein